MKRTWMLLLLLFVSANVWADEEKSVPKKVGEGVQKAGEAAGRGIEKGGEAAAKGLKKAGSWLGKKLQQGGEKLEKASK